MSKMSREQAYRTIAKHIYVAYPTYSSERRMLVVLADEIGEAKKLAAEHLQRSLITVRLIDTTTNAQVYEID